MTPVVNCEERHYWDKRFNFAATLFLVVGLGLLIFTNNIDAILLSFIASVSFRLFNMVMQLRHMHTHIECDEDGGDDMHL